MCATRKKQESLEKPIEKNLKEANCERMEKWRLWIGNYGAYAWWIAFNLYEIIIKTTSTVREKPTREGERKKYTP